MRPTLQRVWLIDLLMGPLLLRCRGQGTGKRLVGRSVFGVSGGEGIVPGNARSWKSRVDMRGAGAGWGKRALRHAQVEAFLASNNAASITVRSSGQSFLGRLGRAGPRYHNLGFRGRGKKTLAVAGRW